MDDHLERIYVHSPRAPVVGVVRAVYDVVKVQLLGDGSQVRDPQEDTFLS